ncbi:hypothetical protein H6785_01060 [Candidatus Nomurabacteria bacterium]|nr:hypothetical protein [Candidatus Kaiserbacteria bacterium]MCB9815159.1 hypothetical protein [Candidatus Nomurabacteria bacterium]
MKNKKNFFGISLFFLLFMYSLSIFEVGTKIYEFRSTYGAAFMDSLEFLSLSIITTSIILLFFNNQIFKLWLNKFMIWFVPISLVLIAMGSVEVNYGWPTRTSMAIGMGVVMVVTTLVFALVQRFYFKVR